MGDRSIFDAFSLQKRTFYSAYYISLLASVAVKKHFRKGICCIWFDFRLFMSDESQNQSTFLFLLR